MSNKQAIVPGRGAVQALDIPGRPWRVGWEAAARALQAIEAAYAGSI
jgi:hypothetical protein